jgi:ABC-2 type transport system permease protein
VSLLASATREWAFQRRERALGLWLVLVLALGALAVSGGIAEVEQQHEAIDRLLESDRADREDALARQSDWGGAAYYSFHLTYDPPSDFAFAALGRRDESPWKHRVRMLALEGQIYEHDAGNPELALTGRFDYAFFAAFVLPLVLAVLLHDLQAGDRAAGRHALLVATSGRASSPWRIRAVLRVLAVYAVALVPLVVGALVSATAPITLVNAAALLLAYVLVWGLICYRVAGLDSAAPVILSILLGIWVMLAVVVPGASRLAVDRLVEAPAGADILLTQREAVNDAWDIPVEVTMDAFLERHPEWSGHAEIEGSFEWKWYYAFQQVGDQKAEALSRAYDAARQERDRLAGLLAWLSPPTLFERTMQRLARTDLKAAMAYEGRVRAFHAELRHYYYARLFPGEPYDPGALTELPGFQVARDD